MTMAETIILDMPTESATNIANDAAQLFRRIESLELAEQVDATNRIKAALHEVSPFRTEPVDCVIWVPAEKVAANDYNPNAVAPPEMKLLSLSIMEDGYTQPIVSWSTDDHFEVVDGFHRNRVGREVPEVKERIHGYLPLAIINAEREDRGDRIAATIRHNRARGKHQIDAMAEIVLELKRRNWSDEKIGKNLGMDPDEVLRLSQITGLAEMFKDREFSEAWEAITDENAINEEDNLSTIEENPDEEIEE